MSQLIRAALPVMSKTLSMSKLQLPSMPKVLDYVCVAQHYQCIDLLQQGPWKDDLCIPAPPCQYVNRGFEQM